MHAKTPFSRHCTTSRRFVDSSSSREIAPALCPQPGPGAGSMGDWRGGDTELSSLLRRLYTSRTNLFSDVTIVCADSKLVAAHKLVLAVTSQYFQAHL